MHKRSDLWAFFVALVLTAASKAGPPLPPPPHLGPAALLHVRFDGPLGMHATFHQGTPAGVEFPSPVVVGLRPGYIHRVKLTRFTELPGVELYPTLEVRGTLHLPPQLRAADHPVPIAISTDDIERVLAGVMVTKVYYLEDPESAFPVAAQKNLPLEIEAPAGQDPSQSARERGRLMLILRLGGRRLTVEEMARDTIPGTIQFPGKTGLAMPPLPPFIPYSHVQLYDTFLGPKPPEEECLKDGGDVGRRVGVDPQGHLLGVDPSDTAASYTDSSNRRQVAISNRICICVPRFGVIRSETRPTGYEQAIALMGAHKLQEHAQARARTPSLLASQNEQLANMRARQRATESAVTQVLDRLVRVDILNAYDVEVELGKILGTNAVKLLAEEQKAKLMRQMELARMMSQPYGTQIFDQVNSGPSVVGRVSGTNVIATIQETRDFTACCGEPPRPPDRPLVLFKWADKQAAQVGDVITFYLKFSNVGGQPITDVAVADSLTARLEYIPGSAQSNRDAVLTTQENEAGSVTLRWEVAGKLLPGDSGIVSFKGAHSLIAVRA